MVQQHKEAGRKYLPIFFLALLLFSSVSFASCYFDTNFGRLMCINQTVIQPPENIISAKAVAMADGFRKLNITPAVMAQKFSAFMNATLKNNNTITIAINATIVTKPTQHCKPATEKDWMAYCQNLWSEGMQLDCWHVNPIAKAEIMERLKKCEYY